MVDVFRKVIFILSLILFIGILVSCSFERKLAREYVKSEENRSVLIIPPDYLFKTSLKEWQVDSINENDEWTRDSILFENSLYLKNIEDSVLLEYYISNYINELKAYGFNVYGEDSLMSFLNGQQNAFIINMAQLEIEEYIMPIKEEAEFGEYIYFEVIDLNAVNLNSWFEISRVNDNESVDVFFTSLYATDDLEGFFTFNYFTGDVGFRYSIDTLLVDEIYQLSAIAGYTYAGYTFDYLMNTYIQKRLLEEGLYSSNIYYHYNRRKKYLVPASENRRFLPLE